MAGNYVTTWTLSREDRERLEVDAHFARAAFERLLGPPRKQTLSPSGWTAFTCPNESCPGRDKFGVKILQGARDMGGYNCYKCGLKGKGFITLCKALQKDPGDFVDGEVRILLPAKLEAPRVTSPLDERNFASVWKWVQQQALLEFGDDSRGLSPEHRANLESRGLTISHLPPWFTIPNGETLGRALQRWGSPLCERACLYKSNSGGRTHFFGEGRMALVYPTAPWLDYSTSFGRIRTYSPPPRRSEREEKFKVLSPAGYTPRNSVYVRASPELGMYPWLIGEGETKPEASRQAGVPSLGLPGMNTGHAEAARIIRTSLQQSNYLIPNALVVCFDTAQDAKHQAYVETAVNALIKAVRAEVNEHCEGYCLPIARLHIPAGAGHKADIDSWIGDRQREGGLAFARKCWRELVQWSLRESRL